MLKVAGHTLIGEGAPHNRQGNRVRRGIGSTEGFGKCACGEISDDTQPSDGARKRWHRQHKENVTDKRPCDDPGCWCCHPPDPNAPTGPAIPAGVVKSAADSLLVGRLLHHDRQQGVVRVDTCGDALISRLADAISVAAAVSTIDSYAAARAVLVTLWETRNG